MSATAPAPVEQRRVMIVDDNTDAADTLAVLLRMHGCVVNVAYDGPTALSAVADFVPDAAVLDLAMPLMSGLEVARALRSKYPRMRLVAHSAFDTPDDRRQAREAGFDALLAKPADLTSLLEALAPSSEKMDSGQAGFRRKVPFPPSRD